MFACIGVTFKKNGFGMETTKKADDPWGNLMQQFQEEEGVPYPSLCVVVTTYNCAQFIGFTLENLIQQNYPNLEIIIIDASSDDRTMEIIRSFQENITHIGSVSEFNRYEMMNRGISLAQSEYITFVFPGDFYVANDSLRYMMRVALKNDKPDLVYCGSMVRDMYGNSKILLRPFNEKLLKSGRQPTSLQSCWFRTEAIRELGKFDPSLKIRGGFDLLCNFSEAKELRFVLTHRVLTDYDRPAWTYRILMRHSRESLKVIFRYYGLFSAFRWWALQNHFRFLKWWLQSLKVVFLGKQMRSS